LSDSVIAPVDFDAGPRRRSADAAPQHQQSHESFELTLFIQDLGGLTAVEVALSTATQAGLQPKQLNDMVLWIARDVAI
jgi:hypothetical protein